MRPQGPMSHGEAMDRRAREVLESVIEDQRFMDAIREGVAASLRGERGVPLKELQAAERSERPR